MRKIRLMIGLLAGLLLLSLVGPARAETPSQAQENSKKVTCQILRSTYSRACATDANSKYCSMVPPGCPESSGAATPR